VLLELAATLIFWFAAATLATALPGRGGHGLTALRGELQWAAAFAFGICAASLGLAELFAQPLLTLLGGSLAWILHVALLAHSPSSWSLPRLRWMVLGAMILAAAVLEITVEAGGTTVFASAVFLRHVLMTRRKMVSEMGNLTALHEKILVLEATRSGAAAARDNSPKAS
jgi:hypothetical protein